MIDFKEFGPVSHEKWLDKIDEDLKGAKVHGDFKYEIDPDWVISPFVSETAPGDFTIQGPKTMAGFKIRDKSEANANIKALQGLMNGAQGLVFEVGPMADFSLLFAGIHLEMVSVILRTDNEPTDIIPNLKNYLQTYAAAGSHVIVATPENSITLDYHQSFRNRLAMTKEYLEHSRQSELSPLVFVGLKTNFLAQMAELRAIRMIWAKAGGRDNDLTIVSESDPAVAVSRDVHPLIVSTYLLMSAVTGMSNMAVSIPWDDNPESARTGLNIMHVLEHESHLSRVVDPVAGSFLISRISREMAGI